MESFEVKPIPFVTVNWYIINDPVRHTQLITRKTAKPYSGLIKLIGMFVQPIDSGPSN